MSTVYFVNKFLPHRWQQLTVLFLVAFVVRALVFGLYIHPHGYYKQADSNDYHYCAFSMAVGHGMVRPDNAYPIFWRTPGYPLFLTYFYRIYNAYVMFDNSKTAHTVALWVQVLLCSLTPILIFFLALSLTHLLSLAWIAAWISVFHLGFVLASCFFLSEGLALLFLFLFYIFFYRSFRFIGEPAFNAITVRSMLINVVYAALFLALYTWIRPNGQFTVVLAAIILLFGVCAWKIKLSKIAIFMSLFFLLLSPWYIRNYNLTGRVFFCPMLGPYLQTFCAPKVLRDVTKQPLLDCMKFILSHVVKKVDQSAALLKQKAPHLYFAREFCCGEIAWPIIKQYPFYFVMEWIKEVFKTTFDPYASQLVAFVNNTYTYDPIEEFLGEKILLCFTQAMPPFMRFVCWLEFFFLALLWIGLLIGCWLFLIRPFFVKVDAPLAFYRALWFKTGLFIGGTLVMTGGFGYARLRLPVEPLMIILSLTCWLWLLGKKPSFKQGTRK